MTLTREQMIDILDRLTEIMKPNNDHVLKLPASYSDVGVFLYEHADELQAIRQALVDADKVRDDALEEAASKISEWMESQEFDDTAHNYRAWSSNKPEQVVERFCELKDAIRNKIRALKTKPDEKKEGDYV